MVINSGTSKHFEKLERGTFMKSGRLPLLNVQALIGRQNMYETIVFKFHSTKCINNKKYENIKFSSLGLVRSLHLSSY